MDVASAAAAAVRGYVPFYGSTVFSNFHRMDVEFRGHVYPSSEHAFMAAKALCFGDDETLRAIQKTAPSPMSAKMLGRRVSPYDDELWCSRRFDYMVEVLESRFKNPDARAALVATGDAVLVEASPRDHVWGVGVGHEKAVDETNWRGANLLGAALMVVRSRIVDTDAQKQIAAEYTKKAFDHLEARKSAMRTKRAKTT